MTGNTVICLEIEAVLFVTVRVVTNTHVIIDIQTFAGKLVLCIDKLDIRAIAILVRTGFTGQKGILRFIISNTKH